MSKGKYSYFYFTTESQLGQEIKKCAPPLLVFSLSEWGLPLDVFTVPGWANPIGNTRRQKKAKKYLHLFDHCYLWKLGYKLVLLIHNTFRHSVYINMQSLEGYSVVVSLEIWWRLTCLVTSSSFQPQSCHAFRFWMKLDWVAKNNRQEITKCFPV